MTSNDGWQQWGAAPNDCDQTFRILKRLRATLPNELEFEVDRILAEEPGCRKRHILFAIRYYHPPVGSQGEAWKWAITEFRKRLQKEDPPPYFNADGSST